MAKSHPTVAQFLTDQIARSGKTQAEIARECDLQSPNVITMFKQGKSKLPLARVPSIARALGVDPKFLFDLAMNEYDPDTWKAIQKEFLGPMALTDNEVEFIKVIRQARIPNPRLRNKQDRERLLAFVNSLE